MYSGKEIVFGHLKIVSFFSAQGGSHAYQQAGAAGGDFYLD